MTEKLTKLERRLGYKFKDEKLLERALTHRSWAHENKSDPSAEVERDDQNESLEFVGDSVIGLIMAEELYLANPTSNEGQLTLMKHRLVSTETLAKVAGGLDLGSFLLMGRGEEKTGGRGKQALLADALEAIIGAVFFDSGYPEARQFIKKIFAKELKMATPDSSSDFKTVLQEKLQSQRLGTPSYHVVKTDGPPHERVFSVEAVWETGKASGYGTSIKSAEMMAAKLALEHIAANRQKPKPKQAVRRKSNSTNE
jgi:ribonuclease-3